MAALDSELLASIDAIYDTVLDASRWSEALDRTASAAGAFGAMLMVSDGVMPELQVNVTSGRIAGHDANAYVATQRDEDELRFDRMLDERPALSVLHDTEIWPDRKAYESRKTLCANRIEPVRRALSIAPPLLDVRRPRNGS